MLGEVLYDLASYSSLYSLSLMYHAAVLYTWYCLSVLKLPSCMVLVFQVHTLCYQIKPCMHVESATFH